MDRSITDAWVTEEPPPHVNDKISELCRRPEHGMEGAGPQAHTCLVPMKAADVTAGELTCMQQGKEAEGFMVPEMPSP